ncbi:MAG: Flp pilus assembly protein CpaB [Candidatus Nealsonbacteria bacterium]|nr:Flp pilus assembly protein CpaB [Candidatus Nealsonbacteria bacterium]
MKRISPATVTIGVVAVLFGLVTAYVVRHYNDTPEPKATAQRTVSLIRAKINLPKYSRIRTQDLEIVQVPADKLPEGTLRVPSRAVSRLVRDTIMAGQPLFEKDLYGVGEVPMLADQLPPGFRAVTLQVDANSALNGMIQPESLVDVSLTVQNDHPEVGGLATLTLLRRVKVLATSQTRFRSIEDRPGDLQNITVSVSPKQANKLILAQRYGTLSVTLRSSLEDDMTAEAEDNHDLVNPAELLGLPFIPEPESTEKTAQIWRGGQMQEVTFFESEIAESLQANCKDCKKSKAGKKSLGRPTPAVRIGSDAKESPDATPVGPQPTPAGGIAQSRSSRGQVLYVDVEAGTAN